MKLVTSCDTYLVTVFKNTTLGSETLDIDTSKGSPDMDYTAHLQTYRDFVRFLKFGVIAVAIILIGMKIFLV
ncbi:MAG TPA: aa3-type cytochrome c oxidase subunit IV [Hyphomicrobium sp.]|nr:aa3-type cytochrome c oxidase subunit IV [Hyphomicrobium sp.]